LFALLNPQLGKGTDATFHLDIGFIEPPALVGRLQVSPATLVQFRTADLDPSPNATGIDSQSALERHLCHMRERDWVPQAHHLTHHMIMSPG
jgi:hypothetical protein